MAVRRVVLDTIVLVSSLFGGSCGRIVEAFIQGDFALYYSSVIFEEYAGVLRRPKFAALSERRRESLLTAT